jgi:hypothetical protein
MRRSFLNYGSLILVTLLCCTLLIWIVTLLLLILLSRFLTRLPVVLKSLPIKQKRLEAIRCEGIAYFIKHFAFSSHYSTRIVFLCKVNKVPIILQPNSLINIHKWISLLVQGRDGRPNEVLSLLGSIAHWLNVFCSDILCLRTNEGDVSFGTFLDDMELFIV